MPHRRFILGTAGHVDHGKTELVKALTGWDTDRLKEEKERGISIELGFAPLRLDDGTMIGIVDVPGHERFVKQMVAGAGGIDLAMLVVAGDESVMPQTREHLEVLRSLEIESGLVVLTKCDLTTGEMRALLHEDIAELVEGTFFEGAPVVETSVRSGEGIDVLRATLAKLTAEIPPREVTGPFRLAVDRVFHKQGIGVVVTGSCYSGTVAVGQTLELLPSAKEVRVRAVQNFGESRDEGYAGERLALALQGRKLSELERGEMLVTPGAYAPSHLIDARVHVANYAPFELKQRERVRIHHGAREVLGRVVLLDHEVLRSGESGLVQLRLESPVVAGEGDHLVLRKYSPSRVLGGGRVIDARAAKHRRFDDAVLERLRLHESGDPVARLAQVIESSDLHGVPPSACDDAALAALVENGKVVVVETHVFAQAPLARLADRVRELVAANASRFPLRRGLDKEELRQKLKFPHGSTLFNRVLEVAARGVSIHIVGNFVVVGESALADADAREVTEVEKRIRSAGLLFVREAEISTEWSGRHPVAEILSYLRDHGVIVRIGDGGYLHRSAFDDCLARIRQWFDTHDALKVTDVKDLLGLTRKHAIPLLEHLDQERLTIRRGDVRVRGPKLDAAVEEA